MKQHTVIKNSLITAGILGAATGFCFLIQEAAESDTHVPLLFVLAVLFISRFTDGYIYGIVASMIAVVGVNYVFTYPYFAIDFTITGYPVTFIAMLAVACSVSALTTQIKKQEQIRLEAEKEKMRGNLLRAVSHDIRTPLTSIINYADLIGKEPPNSEKIPEYAAVLTRQSERLKRLIEDLVEASKASTGKLEVNLAPCQPGVLLTQAAGEYEQKLKDAGLDLVTRQPETAVTILADGRRLWRVFDNLMNNICKYAQRGTRVYLTLEERDGQAVISFKNTSRAPLDIPAEELLERFVRGDAARGGEGNGLGLSIARSLTELQKGTLELTVDGDLFKVVLRFSELS